VEAFDIFADFDDENTL